MLSFYEGMAYQTAASIGVLACIWGLRASCHLAPSLLAPATFVSLVFRMLDLLRSNFHPDKPEEDWSLKLTGGRKRCVIRCIPKFRSAQ